MERGFRQSRGALALSVMVLIMVIVLLSVVAISNYRTNVSVYRNYDLVRQRKIESSIIEELLVECLYRYDWKNSGWSDFGEWFSGYVNSYGNSVGDWEVEVQVVAMSDVDFGVTPMAMRMPEKRMNWGLLSEQDKMLVNSQLSRWFGAEGPVFAGQWMHVLVRRQGEEQGYRYRIRLLALPVSNLPYLTYDLTMIPYMTNSPATEGSGYRLPGPWEALTGHDWSVEVPYRLRSLLALRVEVFRQLIDPWLSVELLQRFAIKADTLDFSMESSRQAFAERQGVMFVGDREVTVDLAMCPVEQLIVQGPGRIRLHGERHSGALVLMVNNGGHNDPLLVEVFGRPEHEVGPVVGYAMRSWRGESAADVKILSADGTAWSGDWFLWPGVEWQGRINGHVSFHDPMISGQPVRWVLGETVRSPDLGYWSPILNLWEVESGH